MAESLAYRFDDGDGYERYMGRWSRAICVQFVPWMQAPPRAAWLEIGCGTGILSRVIVDTQSPASLEAIDPAPAQVALARRKLADPRVLFEVADACALPYGDATFDVVASALVVNFVPDRSKAMAEMHRVLRPGGVVSGFVWDFPNDGSPSGPVRRALAAVGSPAPPVPGTADSTIEALKALAGNAGFEGVTMRMFDATQRFEDADEFWDAQATGFNPVAPFVERLTPVLRERARRLVAESLADASEGGVAYTARAIAFRATKP